MDEKGAKHLVKVIERGECVVDLFEDHVKKLVTINDFAIDEGSKEVIKTPLVERLTREQGMVVQVEAIYII